jgi:hypothetical protein
MDIVTVLVLPSGEILNTWPGLNVALLCARTGLAAIAANAKNKLVLIMIMTSRMPLADPQL